MYFLPSASVCFYKHAPYGFSTIRGAIEQPHTIRQLFWEGSILWTRRMDVTRRKRVRITCVWAAPGVLLGLFHQIDARMTHARIKYKLPCSFVCNHSLPFTEILFSPLTSNHPLLPYPLKSATSLQMTELTAHKTVLSISWKKKNESHQERRVRTIHWYSNE